MKTENNIYAICDNIRSLYNVGSIFRTSDGAGIDKIFLCGMTGCPDSEVQISRINKTALGAEKTIPWQYYKHPEYIIKKLKSQNIKIYALENTSNARLYNKAKYSFPCALIVGHEVHGIKPGILKFADEIIQIPMYGAKKSLNVATAYGIAIYEMIKSKQ